MKTKKKYIVKTRDFSDQSFKTFEEASAKIEEMLSRKKEDSNNDWPVYWNRMGKRCWIEEVIEISSVVQSPKVNPFLHNKRLIELKKDIMDNKIKHLGLGAEDNHFVILIYRDDVNNAIDKICYANREDYENDLDILDLKDVM